MTTLHPGSDVTWRQRRGRSLDRGAGASPGRCYLPVPGVARPRLLVPVGRPAVAAGAIRRYRRREGRDRLAGEVLGVVARLGLLDRWSPGRLAIVPPHPPAGEVVGDVVEEIRRRVRPDAEVAVYLGVPRGNQKPVLLVLDPDGRLLAVGKVGVSELTRRLARHEADALRALERRPLPGVQIPTVLHAGPWRECELLVQSALQTPRATGPAPARRRLLAAVAIARSGGVRSAALLGDGYLDRLRRRVAELPATADARRLNSLLEALVRRGGTEELEFGSWHGDWGPGNAAVTRRAVLVWDWERFEDDVPLGFDALHAAVNAAVNSAVAAGSSPADAVVRCAAAREGLLAPFGPNALSPLVLPLYLAEVTSRYVGDGHAELPSGRQTVQGLLEGFGAVLEQSA